MTNYPVFEAGFQYARVFSFFVRSTAGKHDCGISLQRACPVSACPFHLKTGDFSYPDERSSVKKTETRRKIPGITVVLFP